MKPIVPVSVIIPYDKDRGYLNDSVKSAVNQTVGCEIITWKGKELLSKNINDAMRTAKGKWIKILAEDDLLTENAIEDLYEGIQGFDWVCADAIDFMYIDGHGIEARIGHLPKFQEMIERNCIHGGTTMYLKDMLLKVGGWNESLWTGEEYELHLRLMVKGYKLNYINKTVYKYRTHDNNKSMNLNEKDREKRREYIKTKIRQRYDKYYNTI